jgi:hypothetical protein
MAKPGQAHPNKIAWIFLVLFGRFGDFQWVTPEKLEKIAPPSLRQATGEPLTPIQPVIMA